MNILEQLGRHRLMPVIVIDSVEHALPLADALVAGGLPVAEVTMRTSAAAESIRRISHRGGLLLGAGTVLSVDLCKQALDCGAQYIVTPGLNPKVVDYCVARGVPITPGVSTCTEIEMALDLGVSTVKFFPAESIGGSRALKAICGPYAHVKFIPTGGITLLTLPGYLEIQQVVAVGGSWMVAKELLSSERFDEVERLTREAVELVKA